MLSEAQDSSAGNPQVKKALRWLVAMMHTDGTPARFNDCAPGIAPPMSELLRLGQSLNVPLPPPTASEGCQMLSASGYVRMSRAGAVLLADVAAIGTDYLPGHAHADTLSYELEIAGMQLVVNRGTSEYGTGPQRQHERGTAAHSTVQLAEADSSEVWAGFRVGRRARVHDLALSESNDGQRSELRAAHDGYRFLPGAPRHHRRWRFESSSLHVEDTLSAVVEGVSRHHLAPELQLEPMGSGRWRVLDRRQRTVAQLKVLAGTARAVPWQHAERFGTLVPAQTLEIKLAEGHAAVCWQWIPCTSSS